MPSFTKTGLRCLGIAESFIKGVSKRSILVGVVMRGDFKIDGFNIRTIEVGGMDSTESIISMVEEFNRRDISTIMLNGCIISWFNVVDLNRVYEETRIPLLCVSYNPSDGIEKYLKEYFPKDWEERTEVCRRNGERHRVILKTGFPVYLHNLGISLHDAKIILNRFTVFGKIPEPIRVSKLIARTILRKKDILRDL
ncbi:MAG: endonuclease dU [Candidatus Asgardarchaeia archaeon]